MNRNKTAFTLVEILIVVAILGILVAIVVPEFSSASEDSKLSNLMSNLYLIRAQLELYKMHHNETYPTNINVQMTIKTDADGTINESGSCGPYLHIFPANPFVEHPVKAVKTNGTPGDGWSYDFTTGVIVANTAGHGDL